MLFFIYQLRQLSHHSQSRAKSLPKLSACRTPSVRKNDLICRHTVEYKHRIVFLLPVWGQLFKARLRLTLG